MKRLLVATILLFSTVAPAVAAGKRPITLDDFFKLKRVADPQISPDGKHVVYVVGEVDLAGNKITNSLWLAPTDKAEPRQLTNPPSGKKDRHPRWSPDSKRILFESNRSGDSQLWIIEVNGGEARQVTSLSTGANTGIWSPDGKHIAFVSAVWPEYSEKPFKESDALNKKRKEETEKNPVKARVFSKLFYRHWDEWVEDKRLHLFVMEMETSSSSSPSSARSASKGDVEPLLAPRAAEPKEPKDVTPGDFDAYPTSSTFSVGDDFTFSPDSKYLVYTAPPERNEAWSTNYDIWRVAIHQPEAPARAENLTKDNPAADGTPRFSPDGKLLAYRAQRRQGFEADRWELMIAVSDASGLLNGKPHSLTADFDGSINEYVWRERSKAILFTAEKKGTTLVFEKRLPRALTEVFINSKPWLGTGTIENPRGTYGSLSISSDGESFACTQSYMDGAPDVVGLRPRPGEVFDSVFSTNVNAALDRQLDLTSPKRVSVKVEGTEMHMWILKPPGFDPKKKWPLVYLVHGGPQGAWEDGWHWRWNPQLWAAQGYVVAMPNPRGSTGFGQKYVDEISGDWGGKCYEDLMAGVEYLEKQPYIDKDRMAAAGASFGGYMMNWFQGHTTKFKTLITHCGVYNFDSMYATTDELWFDEWEHGGPPWGKNRHSYEKHSPHRYAKNFKTPMLIIHNDGDFRVPVSQGFELFTTLQRLGVPSKMINFPDETHFVQKPKNSEYWHKEIFAWLKKYAPPGGK